MFYYTLNFDVVTFSINLISNMYSFHHCFPTELKNIKGFLWHGQSVTRVKNSQCRWTSVCTPCKWTASELSSPALRSPELRAWPTLGQSTRCLRSQENQWLAAYHSVFSQSTPSDLIQIKWHFKMYGNVSQYTNFNCSFTYRINLLSMLLNRINIQLEYENQIYRN